MMAILLALQLHGWFAPAKALSQEAQTHPVLAQATASPDPRDPPDPEEDPAPAPSPSARSTSQNPKGRRGGDHKETEGTTAPNRFEADTVIKSKYHLDGQPLEVDPD